MLIVRLRISIFLLLPFDGQQLRQCGAASFCRFILLRRLTMCRLG